MSGTRFKFKTDTGIGGQTVQLRHKGLWLSKSNNKAITRQIMRARGMLSATIAAIYNGLDSTARGYAATYFLTPPTGPDGGQRAQIMSILEQTYHGLSNDITLKLGGDGDHGFVMRHAVPIGTPGSAVNPADGFAWTRVEHTIHVSKKTLLNNPDLAVISLIHEGSHKFANTWDHGDKGYREEDDSDWELPGLTMAEALVNADSYGYFAFRVGAANGW
jgi:hypothetical protein